MAILPFLFQSAFTLTQCPEALKFFAAMPHLQTAQEDMLFKYLRRNQETVFGKTHQFNSIRSVEDYRRQVPIRTYQDFVPLLEQIRQGQSQVLTTEPVRYFLPTGGTSGTKLIPYTDSLKQEFQQALAPWLSDIARSFPRILGGKTYWSVTPPGHRLKTFKAQKIPVGFEDDSAYLGWKGVLLGSIFAVPSWITQVQSMENFRFLTLYFLLKERNLRWISIWSPTFLLVLLQEIDPLVDALLASVRDGFPHLPQEEMLPVRLPRNPQPKRAKELECALRTIPAERYTRIWPHLTFLSLWQDAYARHPAQQVQQYFPNTMFQGKGLLATEGVMTIPLHAANGSIPAFMSHFLEFVDDEGQSQCLWELEEGHTYAIVLTTGGGLYRYAIGDLVRVTGFYHKLPVLTFLGRTGRFSDLVGEKLDERFVTDAIMRVRQSTGLEMTFILLAPERWKRSQGYVLFIESAHPRPQLISIGRQLDRLLCQNMQYAYARRLGQLQPVRIFRVARNGQAAYLSHCLAEGQQLGDIKPLLFDTQLGWSAAFQGDFMT